MITAEALMQASVEAKPYLLKIMRQSNGLEPEEILGHAVAHAWAKRAAFRGESSLRTWFTTIAVRFYFYELRRNKKHEFISSEVLIESACSRPNPEQRVLALERKQVLVDAILSLPGTQRSEMLLISDGQRSNTTGARKTRRFRARHTLRQQLSKHPIFSRRSDANTAGS